MAAHAPAVAGWASPGIVRAVVLALAVVVSVGAVVDVYRIGESGAKAAWHDSYDQSANAGHN